MVIEKHLMMAELEAGLDEIRQSPKDEGVVQLIVRRPQTGERDVLQQGELDLVDGLVGDNWRVCGSSGTADGSPHPDRQLTIMNARVIALVALYEPTLSGLGRCYIMALPFFRNALLGDVCWTLGLFAVFEAAQSWVRRREGIFSSSASQGPTVL